MRLTSVAISTSDLTEEIEFGLLPVDSRNRYLVRSIVGIDADEIIPKFYGRGSVTNMAFYEYTMKPREIVMRVALNPVFSINESVSEIRDQVYRLISANRSGELNILFKDGASLISGIKGRIIKSEVPYFTRVPELQITIKCDDPMFRGIAPFDILPADLPSTNPVKLTDDLSTAPHGFSFKIEFTAVTASFVIQDDPTTPDWQFELTPATSFQIGDELHFSSEYGAKRLFWDKAVGTDIELMDKVESGSVWPQVFPGLNNLYFMQIANFDWLELTYYPAYWGL